MPGKALGCTSYYDSVPGKALDGCCEYDCVPGKALRDQLQDHNGYVPQEAQLTVIDPQQECILENGYAPQEARICLLLRKRSICLVLCRKRHTSLIDVLHEEHVLDIVPQEARLLNCCNQCVLPSLGFSG